MSHIVSACTCTCTCRLFPSLILHCLLLLFRLSPYSYVLFHTVCATDGFVYVVCVQLCIFNAQSGKRVIYIHTRACRQNVSSSTHTSTLTCTCTYRLLLCFCILTEIRWTVNSEHHKISPPDLKYSASLVEFIMHIEYAMDVSVFGSAFWWHRVLLHWLLMFV